MDGFYLQSTPNLTILTIGTEVEVSSFCHAMNQKLDKLDISNSFTILSIHINDCFYNF